MKYKINKKLEKELDKQFPKGDKSRGKALVLFAIAQIEIDRLKLNIKVMQERIDKLNEEKINEKRS
jgi:hypothetical protein